jgi:hypothetical protein
MKKALGLSAALILVFGLAINWRNLPLSALKIPTASQAEQQTPAMPTVAPTIAPATAVSTTSEWRTKPIKVIKVQTDGTIALSGDGQWLAAVPSSNKKLDTINMYSVTSELWSVRNSADTAVRMLALNQTGDRVATLTQELSTGRIKLELLNQQLDTTYWQKTLSDRPLAKATSTSSNQTETMFAALAFRPGDDIIMTSLIHSQVPSSQVPPENTSDKAEKTSDKEDFEYQTSLHRAETGEVMSSLKTAPNLMSVLDRYAFSPNGKFLAALGRSWPEGSDLYSLNAPTSKTTLNIWQVDEEKSFLQSSHDQNVLQTLNVPDQSGDIAISSDGKVNVLNSPNISEEHSLDNWDSETGENLFLDSWDSKTGGKITSQKIASGNLKSPRGIRLSPDGETAVIASAIGEGTQIQNLKTGKIWDLDINSDISHSNSAFSANGEYLAIATPESILIFGKR